MTSDFHNKLPPLLFYNILHRACWGFKEIYVANFDIDKRKRLYDNRKIFFSIQDEDGETIRWAN